MTAEVGAERRLSCHAARHDATDVAVLASTTLDAVQVWFKALGGVSPGWAVQRTFVNTRGKCHHCGLVLESIELPGTGCVHYVTCWSLFVCLFFLYLSVFCFLFFFEALLIHPTADRQKALLDVLLSFLATRSELDKFRAWLEKKVAADDWSLAS